MNLAALERRVEALASRMEPPPVALSALDVARRSGFEPDNWQANLLRSGAQQAILLCSRQSGKSTVTSVLAAHQAAFTPGSLTLIVSPSLRQSGELYLKVRSVLAALGDVVPPASQENATELRLGNGSRVVSLPSTERTVRGFSAPDLLIIDEAARVDDAMYTGLRPMLAISQGRLVLLSTPFGKRGFLYREWTEGGPDWLRVLVTAYDVPRISREWLEQERAAIGSWHFDQEFLCIFKDAHDQFFRSEDIVAMESPDIVPLFGKVV